MRLFIIRHGQTTNNVLMAEIYARRDRGEITPQEAEEEWLAKRVDDPAITETVRSQAISQPASQPAAPDPLAAGCDCTERLSRCQSFNLRCAAGDRGGKAARHLLRRGLQGHGLEAAHQ
jgi:hypothetical protein